MGPFVMFVMTMGDGIKCGTYFRSPRMILEIQMFFKNCFFGKGFSKLVLGPRRPVVFDRKLKEENKIS